VTPPRPVSLFLVERYLQIADLNELAATVASAASVCDDRRRDGATLRYVHSTFVPGDETCFCVFEAESAHDVNVLNVDIDFRIDRISPAVSLHTAPGSSPVTRPRPANHPRKKLP
jgi:hypothetical protein